MKFTNLGEHKFIKSDFICDKKQEDQGQLRTVGRDPSIQGHFPGIHECKRNVVRMSVRVVANVEEMLGHRPENKL
jgi:hypothetical protein